MDGGQYFLNRYGSEITGRKGARPQKTTAKIGIKNKVTVMELLAIHEYEKRTLLFVGVNTFPTLVQQMSN